MPISFKELMETYELASMGSSAYGEHHAYLCRESGKIYWHSEFSDLEEVNDELPEDIEDEDKYIQLSSKRELDLGVPLVMDFVRQVLPRDFDDVSDMFDRRGAYGRFKQLLTRRRALQQWYDFEQQATERAQAARERLAAVINTPDHVPAKLEDVFARPLPELDLATTRERLMRESPELSELHFAVERAKWKVARESAGRSPK